MPLKTLRFLGTLRLFLGPIAKAHKPNTTNFGLSFLKDRLLRIRFPTGFLANPHVCSVVEAAGFGPVDLFTDGETWK